MSRAWRRSAGWLSDLLSTRNLVEGKICRRKAAGYEHPRADPFKAKPQQMDSFNKFLKWQEATSVELLGNTSTSWEMALRNMAVANAEKEERAARNIAMLKRVCWVRGGPAGGLRRQHRFTRNAAGWMPAEKTHKQGR